MSLETTRRDAVEDTSDYQSQEQQVFQKKKTIFRAYQIFWYILGVLDTLLILRFTFKLAGANPYTSFTAFLYIVTAIFVWPFQGIFPYVGNSIQYIEWASLVAILIYSLVIFALVMFLHLIRPVTPEEIHHAVDEEKHAS